MSKKNISKKWYAHEHFLSGLAFSSFLFLIVGGLLYSGGFLQIGSEESYANSLSPRKSGPNWYTAPTPDPSGWDQIAPLVTFVTPINGSTVDAGSKVGTYYIVPVELSVSDNDRISQVAIYVNNVLDGVQYVNATTYKATARIPNQAGTYEIKAIAYDYNGNPGTASASVIVPKGGK